jgi:methionine biosynthesis protein MetW
MSGTRADTYYDAYWESEGWETRPPRKLVELFERHVAPGHRCLDVGCGDGGTSGVWLQQHAAQYVGVDISKSAVRAACERGLDARVIDDDASLPFADGSFDVAVCIEVLEHLFAPQKTLSEIRRVLRPGGRVVVTVPNIAHWRNRLDLAVLGRFNPRGDSRSPTEPWRDPHLRFFTLGSLAALLEQDGFEIVERGGHAEHGLLHHLPGLRRLARSPEAGTAMRRSASLLPRQLAESIYAVGQTRGAHP